MADEMDIAEELAPRAKRLTPWVEKYRPERVDDVSHQEEVVKTLKTSIEQGSLPHLLFHGPPGTGKTTTILAVGRELFGPDLYKQRILELNASDERGISVIREKVKIFAQGAVGGQKTSGYPCPRFKIIILDEADTMTPDAQSALRRIMETYSKVTRFCLVCNYVTRIIEPLASRCAKFRFKSLPMDSMLERMRFIAQSENVVLADGALDTIMKASNGDMRKAVTYLQSAHQLCIGDTKVVTKDVVLDISCKVPANAMSILWEKMSLPQFDPMRACVDNIINEGYPMGELLMQLHDDTIQHISLSDLDKALICEKIAQADQCLVDGASEKLQLLDVASYIMRRINKMWNGFGDGLFVCLGRTTVVRDSSSEGVHLYLAMNRETSFVNSGAESLVWTEFEAKEMFQRHRLWVTYIGTALDPDKQHKGVPPVYLWPEQKRLLDQCKVDSQQHEVDNVSKIDLVTEIEDGQPKKRKHEEIETNLPDMDESSSNNNHITDNNDDFEISKKKRARTSWFGDTLNILQQGFFNTIGRVYNWFQQSLFGTFSTKNSNNNQALKENDAYMSTEDVNFSIFTDLRSRGYFVGPGDVYGGDFNIYKGGDPSNSHSAATIRVVRKKRIAVRDLLSFSRVQNHVAKSAVFSFIEPTSNKPAYLIANFRNVSDRL